MDDLLAPFYAAHKPRPRWRIGTEMEKFGILIDGGPLPYEGEASVMGVFERLIERHGWYPEREYSAGEVISLRRGAASVTLEPGGQFELSGAPHETAHQTSSEFLGHMAELFDISEEFGITWLGLGFHPFARPQELPWVPKQRYAIMREYLPTRGSMALDMMRRTATVQANLDYSSEEDAMRKLRLALRLSPIVTAMFANSPLAEGRVTGERSRRARVWLNMDPDRSGLLPFMWKAGPTYADYVQWALTVPMFLLKRGNDIVRNTGQTFGDFMKNGFEGHRATRADWDMHLNTLFPEVRLKNTIEVRGADSQDTSMVCALPAVWKGLLYCDEATSKVEALTESLRFEDAQGCREDVADHALLARLSGREIAEWAWEVLEIAESGLERCSNLDAEGRDESIHLTSLKKLVGQKKAPADLLLAQLEGADDFRQTVLEHARV